MRTQIKRKRQRKTDYKARIALLKSGIPRIVIRLTNKYIVLQSVESDQAQDKITLEVSSKDLLKNGWDEKFKGSLKSLPAAYLTGLVFAKKIGKGEFIVDTGLAVHKPKNRIYSSVNGLVDGGLKVHVDPVVFPAKERLEGKHMKEELQTMILKIKSTMEKNG
jgi:large subunit ribosomal protein L18